MRNIAYTTGLIALATATPLFAQDAAPDEAADAVEGAIEAAIEAAEAAISPTPTPAPLPPGDYTASPELVDFSALQAKPADYPRASWVAGEEGSVYYSLAIDASGNVTDCTIIDGSGFETLDAKTCEIALERAQFEPALDQEGNPVAGEHRDYQVWNKREPQFPGTSTIQVEFTVTETGQVVDCNSIEASGVMSEQMRRTLQEEPCPGMNRTSGVPFRDADGNPISKRVNLTIDVTVSDLEE